MTGNLTTTKKIAGVVGACAVLLGGVACTKTVDGKAAAAPIEETSESSSSKSSSESSSESSESSSESSESSSESSESSSGSSSSGESGGGTAQAPDEPYSYTDGTTVKLDAPIPDPDDHGLLSSETGRILPFHIDNKSEWTLDMANTADDADIDCNGTSQWVFDSAFTGPPTVPSGGTGDFQLSFALEQEAVGATCTIEIPFEADGASSVDVATFSMVIS